MTTRDLAALAAIFLFLGVFGFLASGIAQLVLAVRLGAF